MVSMQESSGRIRRGLRNGVGNAIQRGTRGRARRLGMLLAVLAATSAGCASVGREFPVAPVRSIEVGVTTQQQVRALFGQPWRQGYEDGQRTWTYARYRYNILGAAQARDLKIRFDDRGVVSSYTFDSTYPEDSRS